MTETLPSIFNVLLSDSYKIILGFIIGILVHRFLYLGKKAGQTDYWKNWMGVGLGILIISLHYSFGFPLGFAIILSFTIIYYSIPKSRKNKSSGGVTSKIMSKVRKRLT